MAFLILAFWWIVPGVYVLLSLFLFFKKRGTQWSKAAAYSLPAYIFGLVLGSMSILSSRGSTASIGFIFLPYVALLPAFFGAAFGFFEKKSLRWFIGLCLFAVFAFGVFDIWKIRSRNEMRDKEAIRQGEEIKKNEAWVQGIEQSEPEKASQVFLERARQTEDRTILIPLARSSKASEEMLTLLSANSDFGVVLTVVRNPNTPAEVLEKIYKTHSYPDYFFSELSRNPKTPSAILMELYNKKDQNTGIPTGLASNPEIPEKLVPLLAESSDPLVLGELARNPKVDCGVTILVRNNIEVLPPETRFRETGLGWAEEKFKECLTEK